MASPLAFIDEGKLQLLVELPGTIEELRRVAGNIASVARELCPVDTGALVESIVLLRGLDSIGVYFRIGSNLGYAIFVELGTYKMAAQPYLRPAIYRAA